MSFESLKKALGRPVFGTRRPRGRRRDRGVAMLLVISSIAILTAVAVDFQYNSSVDLQLAANARDELRAEYLARSAINISRLLLVFQKQVDGQANLAGQALQGLIPGAGAGGGLNIRLWEIVPVDCNLLGMLLGAAEPSLSASPIYGEDGEPIALPLFGDFAGGCSAEISDEESKVNLNRLDMGAISGQAPMQQALLMLADPRFEFLFDKGDAHGVKMTPQETLIALHDWIDERDTQAVLNVTGTGDPFQDGFGDENRNYLSKYPHRYRSKNAPFDTLDELYQVDGVSDLFMAAFRDRLTVYPDKNKLLNINTNDPVQLWVNIATVAADENDPKLRNPLVVQSILQEISWAKMFSFFGMNAMQFVQIVKRNGIVIKPDIEAGGAKNNKWITDKSETFTIKATGQAGKVEKTITAVIRNDSALGKVLYFRQE